MPHRFASGILFGTVPRNRAKVCMAVMLDGRSRTMFLFSGKWNWYFHANIFSEVPESGLLERGFSLVIMFMFALKTAALGGYERRKLSAMFVPKSSLGPARRCKNVVFYFPKRSDRSGWSRCSVGLIWTLHCSFCKYRLYSDIQKMSNT